MFRYLFTNDLRISNLSEFMVRAGKCFYTDTVPSANENKNDNNNMNTLGFYFDLTKSSNCTKLAIDGQVRLVVLNFIKKFQFPNPRTQESYNNAIEDGITIAPLRLILQVLYNMNMTDKNNAYLTRDEIADFIFFNPNVAKTTSPNIPRLIADIIGHRNGEPLPSVIETEDSDRQWKQWQRQLREMVKVITWSGCAIETDDNRLVIHHDSLTNENKSALFDVLTYTDFWKCESNVPFNQVKENYQSYMDIKDSEYRIDENEPSSSLNELVNEYQRAAEVAKKYAIENGVDVTARLDDVLGTYEQFQQRFSPEKLLQIPDSEICTAMFYSAAKTNDSLCYRLEKDKECKEFMGNISGGFAYVFGLFQKTDTGIWMSGSSVRPEELTEEQAVERAKEIRDSIVAGAKIIDEASLEKLEDYEKLDDKLNEVMGQWAYRGWIHKYYSMLYPKKLSCFHSTDWQKHILFAFGIMPSEKYYARSGQIAMIQGFNNWVYYQLSLVTRSAFGRVKSFIRVGSTDGSRSYGAEWKKRGIVGVGWRDLGSLNDYVTDRLDRSAVADKLQELYYPDDPRSASKKAGEIQTFYNTDDDTVFVVMKGQQLIALVDHVGSYTYDKSSDMAHIKTGKWHDSFLPDEKLPFKSVGKFTTCYEINDDENLLFLYRKYFYEVDNGQMFENIEMIDDETESGDENIMEYSEPVYNTSFKCDFDLNRIVFGAPGTGKSHRIKEDCTSLLSDGGSFERITFHPDYTYSQFVGTYKPVTDLNGHIEYKFVPGPFMRVYVDSIKSGKTESPKPFLLIVEEINRAKVASVFGDVFQLLDRDEDGVSEYEIQPSEDVRKYLASELGGKARDYLKIQLPNNMLIWATMNSADQGVFPMDTAFKRRWGFDYLGINENDDKITGHLVLGQGEYARDVEWNTLRRAINEKLTADYKINEDKLLGPFFIEKKYYEAISGDNYSEDNREEFIRVFKSKVIMYLFEDAAKQYKHKLFDGCEDTTKYSSICSEFDRIGIKIFGDSFESDFYNPQRAQ